MRMLHLYELRWVSAGNAEPKNFVTADNGELIHYQVNAASRQLASNSQIRNLYNYLWSNGNTPYMTELPNGDIRIQYFKKENNQ